MLLWIITQSMRVTMREKKPDTGLPYSDPPSPNRCYIQRGEL